MATTKKIERLRKALSFKEPDRIPVGEFFWTGFLKKCRRKWGEDFDPYRHFDLDYIVITPNMDPKIQSFEIVSQSGEDIVIKTGFGATIKRTRDIPVPHYETVSVNKPEEMAEFEFDGPSEERRFYKGGDDQINCVGDALHRDIPSWEQRLEPYVNHFAVFGSVCEPYEYLWRIIGTENALYWMVETPELLSAFIDRIGGFLVDFTKAQIAAGKGRLSGMYLWGDVAYRNGMLFGADRWRKLFKPYVKNLIDLCHSNDLMVIYHGCGDAREILPDMVELKLDAYNPLEVKAGLDVIDLKQQYADKLAFCGNIDVRVLESNDKKRIRQEVLYKMHAGKGGGWIFQSDHSVSSDVEPESYELALKILREEK